MSKQSKNGKKPLIKVPDSKISDQDKERYKFQRAALNAILQNPVMVENTKTVEGACIFACKYSAVMMRFKDMTYEQLFPPQKPAPQPDIPAVRQ